MEGNTFVKNEPEEDLEHTLSYEEKFEIKSEIDLPIKSEDNFKEEIIYYQQTECWPGHDTFLPIKEELPLLCPLLDHTDYNVGSSVVFVLDGNRRARGTEFKSLLCPLLDHTDYNVGSSVVFVLDGNRRARGTEFKNIKKT
uniref:Uncharacterized protein n=1 Tax=Timema genevievae TaxID=629358 RepID=A0A7R9K6G7_TIMGE|nr:unnamed protein product [Timema genevievae]